MESRSEFGLWTEKTHSWVRISHGSNKFSDEFEQQWNRNSWRSARRICVKTQCKKFCMSIKGSSKTTKNEKNSHNLQSQWHVVSTLCQEKNHVTRKVGFEGTPKLGPCWKSKPATYMVKFERKYRPCLQIQLSLVGHKFSWFECWSRTSATTKRTTTICRKPLRCSSKMLRWKRMYLLLWAESRLNQNHKDVIMPAHPQELYPSGKESGLFEPGDSAPVACPLWKQLSTLLRHGHLPQEDGAIEFLESKDYLWNKFVRSQHWADEMWKSRMTKGGGNKKRFQSYWFIRRNLLLPSSPRSFRTQSYWNVIPSNFFQHIYLIGCAFNLHSVINTGWILGGQNSSKRQKVFCLLVDLMDISHKDRDVIDLSVPRHAQCLHKAKTRLQDTVYWVDIKLAIETGSKFFLTRSNLFILEGTLPAVCIPTVVRMKIGEVFYEKVYLSPRPPPKISLKQEWKREMGSPHAQRTEIGQQSRSFQSNQTTLNPVRERSGRLDFTRDGRKTSR